MLKKDNLFINFILINSRKLNSTLKKLLRKNKILMIIKWHILRSSFIKEIL